MELLDLNSKEIELFLRLYLNRCDRKPLTWSYYNAGYGTEIKVQHEGDEKTVTFDDLLNFFFQGQEIMQRQEYFSLNDRKPPPE